MFIDYKSYLELAKYFSIADSRSCENSDQDEEINPYVTTLKLILHHTNKPRFHKFDSQ